MEEISQYLIPYFFPFNSKIWMSQKTLKLILLTRFLKKT